MSIRISMLMMSTIAVSLVSVNATAEAAGDFIAVTWDGEILRIDPATGAATLANNSGLERLNSIARSSSGRLLSIRSGGGFPTSVPTNLAEIDEATNTASLSIQFSNDLDCRALAFSQTDQLFGVIDGGFSSGFAEPDFLYTIDPVIGEGTMIGSIGLGGVQSLAFGPAGTLYGWDSSNPSRLGAGLVTINPETGAATDLFPLDTWNFSFQSIEFDSHGSLYAVTSDGAPGIDGPNNSLFSIDLTTGVPTPIGSFGNFDVRGIAYIPNAHSLSLFGVASLGFARRRRSPH